MLDTKTLATGPHPRRSSVECCTLLQEVSVVRWVDLTRNRDVMSHRIIHSSGAVAGFYRTSPSLSGRGQRKNRVEACD